MNEVILNGFVPVQDLEFRLLGKVVRVVHRAPGKHGKQEYRDFNSFEDALAYAERNFGMRLAGTVGDRKGTR